MTPADLRAQRPILLEKLRNAVYHSQRGAMLEDILDADDFSDAVFLLVELTDNHHDDVPSNELP